MLYSQWCWAGRVFCDIVVFMWIWFLIKVSLAYFSPALILTVILSGGAIQRYVPHSYCNGLLTTQMLFQTRAFCSCQILRWALKIPLVSRGRFPLRFGPFSPRALTTQFESLHKPTLRETEIQRRSERYCLQIREERVRRLYPDNLPLTGQL